MNVTVPLRLKTDEAKKIKDFAKENKTSMSAMITYKIRQYVIGDLTLTPPQAPDIKQTSAAVPFEDMEAFKSMLEKQGIAFDEAIRQLISTLVSDLDQHDEP